MAAPRNLDDRDDTDCALVVFAVWAVAAPAALCLVLEGLARDGLALGLTGVACLAAGFAGHVIAKAHFRRDFGFGELALGLIAAAVLALVLLAAAIGTPTSGADRITFFVLFLVVVGFFALYLTTRFGLRHTFSRFHHRGSR